MKQPFGYYGGKRRLVPELLKLIPSHNQYCEVFIGGGSLFWNKTPSKSEVINDFDGMVTNFYMQLKTNYEELNKMIQGTLHSEILHTEAQNIIFKEPEKHSDLKKAWAWWVCTNLSFSFVANGGFAFSNSDTNSKGTKNKRARFTEMLCKRIEKVEIFNRDAVEVIELKSTPETLIFADPPYYNSDMGHYDGYKESDFVNLLNCLANTKAKFILTSYPSDILNKFREEYGWGFKDIQQIVSVNGMREETKYKTECITYNFDPPSSQYSFLNENNDFLFAENEDD